ncbi:MAG TPA: hypothetical protein ENI23_05855 [bacterium]|nr:hypothetical protein [bacterium]
METVRDVCKYIGGIVRSNPTCVETGCSHMVPSENLIHTTTNNLARYICSNNGGVLYSLDIDGAHVKSARKLVAEEASECRCIFVLGDSVESLKNLEVEFSNSIPRKSVDVLCLDSKEFDEDHMVNEYMAISRSLWDEHFVLVDDIHNLNSVKYKKMVPILKDLGYSYFEVATPTGLFVATKGYGLPSENR